jgi:hypothetical protein
VSQDGDDPGRELHAVRRGSTVTATALERALGQAEQLGELATVAVGTTPHLMFAARSSGKAPAHT